MDSLLHFNNTHSVMIHALSAVVTGSATHSHMHTQKWSNVQILASMYGWIGRYHRLLVIHIILHLNELRQISNTSTISSLWLQKKKWFAGPISNSNLCADVIKIAYQPTDHSQINDLLYRLSKALYEYSFFLERHSFDDKIHRIITVSGKTNQENTKYFLWLMFLWTPGWIRTVRWQWTGLNSCTMSSSTPWTTSGSWCPPGNTVW